MFNCAHLSNFELEAQRRYDWAVGLRTTFMTVYSEAISSPVVDAITCEIADRQCPKG